MSITTKFRTEDLELMKQKGISQEVVEKQLNYFRTGFEFANIIRPATIGDGIIKLQDSEIEAFENEYDSAIKKQRSRKVCSCIRCCNTYV